MRIRNFLAIAVSALGVPLAFADNEVPVGDLLHPSGQGPIVRPVERSGFRSGKGGASPKVEPLDPLPPLQENELAEAVRALSGVDMLGAVTPDGSAIRVPEPSTAAVLVAVARLRGQRIPSVDLEFTLAAVGSSGITTLLAARESVPSGVLRVFADATDRNYLADYDVEIAQTSEIMDPVVRVLRTGSSLKVRVQPLPGGRAAMATAIATVMEPLALPPIDAHHPDMGPIDRGAVAVEESRACFRLEPGKAAIQEWTGRDGRRIRLTMTARWNAPPLDAGTGAVLWSPLLQRPLRSFWFVPHSGALPGSESDERWPTDGRADEAGVDASGRLSRVLLGRDAKEAVMSESGYLVLAGKEAASVRDLLAVSLERDLRACAAEVAVLDVPEGAAPGPDGSVPEGGKVVFRLSASLLPGLWAHFSSGEQRGYLADWDVEVAQGALIADPLIDCAVDGAFLNLRLDAAEGGPVLAAHLDFQLAHLERMDLATTPLKEPRVGAAFTGTVDRGNDTVTVDAPMRKSGGPKAYIVEEPVIHDLRVVADAPFGADGTCVLRRSAAGFAGPGRELVFVIRAK